MKKEKCTCLSLLEEIEAIVIKVRNENDSNGRFNACEEILALLSKRKEEL